MHNNNFVSISGKYCRRWTQYTCGSHSNTQVSALLSSHDVTSLYCTEGWCSHSTEIEASALVAIFFDMFHMSRKTCYLYYNFAFCRKWICNIILQYPIYQSYQYQVTTIPCYPCEICPVNLSDQMIAPKLYLWYAMFNIPCVTLVWCIKADYKPRICKRRHPAVAFVLLNNLIYKLILSVCIMAILLAGVANWLWLCS